MRKAAEKHLAVPITCQGRDTTTCPPPQGGSHDKQQLIREGCHQGLADHRFGLHAAVARWTGGGDASARQVRSEPWAPQQEQQRRDCSGQVPGK